MADSPGSSTPVPPQAKQKGLLDLFRRPSNTAAHGANDATVTPAIVEPTPAETADPSTSTSDGKTSNGLLSPAPPTPSSGLTSTQIDDQWRETIAEAKAKVSIMGRLKRLTSKDGKSKSEKGNAKEIEEVDIAAMIPLPEDPKTASNSASPAPTPAPGTSTPGANTLSRRIQVLLSSVPPFLHTVPDTTDPTKIGTIPVPPMPDSKLLGYLSSPGVMNGADGGATVSGTGTPSAAPSSKQRKSVWQVLDRLVPYKPPNSTTEPAAGADVEEEASETSLMLYAPLFPEADSKVELAKSELIEVNEREEIQELGKDVAEEVATALWPDKLKFPPFWKKKKQPPQEVPPPSDPVPTPKPKGKEVKIWIPSKTQISFQVAWWGYRLWLPPPIMLILGDKTVEASKRAAMITTAIGWLINNIPTAVLPPPLRTAVTLLKGIVPILGYVGGFIAWSWAEIKSFDKGNGVVLSATWLLPIALIPSSWEDQETNLPIGKGEEKPVPAPDQSTGKPSSDVPGPSTGIPPTKDTQPPATNPEPQPAPPYTKT